MLHNWHLVCLFHSLIVSIKKPQKCSYAQLKLPRVTGVKTCQIVQENTVNCSNIAAQLQTQWHFSTKSVN